MEASGMDLAERLGHWVNAFDAIGLRAAHQSIGTLTTAGPGKPSAPKQTPLNAATADFLRVRTALADLIAKQPLAASTSYAAYHQRHLKLQREMEQMIAPLRDRLRQALGRVSPTLRQLAALDAVLEQVIAPREQMLLATACNLISRRFEQLQHDDPASWHEAFANDWRQALLSELDLRLEPVMGLIDALRNESKNQL
jgi:hypothetical protein